MTWKCLRNDTRKAREAHTCWLCDKQIDPGEVYIYRIGVDQSNLVEMHMHVICEEVTSGWDAMDWETFSQGDLQTHINQE